MDDAGARALLEPLVVTPPALHDWSDVLRRAERRRRRLRLRRIAVASVASVGVLVGSLASAVGLPLGAHHTHEPHILLRVSLLSPAGARVGSLELEVPRVYIVYRRQIVVQPFRPAQVAPPAIVRVSWFLSLRPNAAGADVSLAGLPRGRAALCRSCTVGASGRVGLTTDGLTALLNGKATAVVSRDAHSEAIGTARLEQTQLRLGLICARGAAGHLDCTRMYTGRP